MSLLRYIGEIQKLNPGHEAEIHITDAIKNLILKGEIFFAKIFSGKYLDCGTLKGYIKSGIEISKESRWIFVWSELVMLV